MLNDTRPVNHNIYKNLRVITFAASLFKTQRMGLREDKTPSLKNRSTRQKNPHTLSWNKVQVIRITYEIRTQMGVQ
jgi:hypothetical protein